MNPRRMHALLSAYQRPAGQRTVSVPRKAANGKPVQYIDFDGPITEQGNLAEYFMRGE